MEWFHLIEEDKRERSHDSLASSREIQSAFAQQRDDLKWIALLITGDQVLADQAVISASGLSTSYSTAFRDWLAGWTKSATVRTAVREVRDLIYASASCYTNSSCENPGCDVFSNRQIASLRHVNPQDIIAALDPLARSALVLRGIHHLSIADCAVLLDMPPRIVAAAYCQAFRWNNQRADTPRTPNQGKTSSQL
jgi:DNA-directed RNA polymerase specialized sigma24 family protein